MVCPSCMAEQEGPVEDYVISGRKGHASLAIDQCGDCDAFFAVEYVGNNTFDVQEDEDQEDEDQEDDVWGK